MPSFQFPKSLVRDNSQSTAVLSFSPVQSSREVECPALMEKSTPGSIPVAVTVWGKEDSCSCYNQEKDTQRMEGEEQDKGAAAQTMQ